MAEQTVSGAPEARRSSRRQGKVTAASWPQIEVDVRDVAEPLSLEVKRRRGTAMPSVHQEERLEEDVLTVVNQALAQPKAFNISPALAVKLAREEQFRMRVVRSTMWMASLLWPISPFIYNNSGIENLDCMAWNHWVASQQGLDRLDFRSGTPFKSEEECKEWFIKVMTYQGVSGETAMTESMPAAEVHFGSVLRMAVVEKPILTDQSLVQASIRIPSGSRVRSLDDYVHDGVMPQGIATFLQAVVLGRGSILVAGPIGSGKTTLLRVLASNIPPWEIVVVIEDGPELNLDRDRGDGHPWHPMVRSLSTLPTNRAAQEVEIWTMSELVRRALRLNANRLILGEARGPEMAVITEAVLAGQAGGMSTIHGETSELAYRRAYTLLRRNREYAEDLSLARDTVAEAFNVIVVIDRDPYDLQRRVTEVVALQSANERTTVYKLNPRGPSDTFMGWERVTERISELGRLEPRIRPYLPAGRDLPLPT